MIRRVYNWILARPIVYNGLRPIAVGGIDLSETFEQFGVGPEDRVLDIGCGTGAALGYLRAFSSYTGNDVDPCAVEFARARHGRDKRVHFVCGELSEALLLRADPTVAVLSGVLHHLDDGSALHVMRLLRRAESLTRVLTIDIVYLEGKTISNLFARLDRGRFCRKEAAYQNLVKEAGYDIVRSVIVRSAPRTGLAWYITMTLKPVLVK